MNSLRCGYRAFTSYWWKHWFNPPTYYNWAKWKIKRANKGWSEYDAFSLDWYLSSWLPDALRYLKTRKCGIPCEMFNETDGIGNPTKEVMEEAEGRWDAILDKMIGGFEAKNRISNILYEEELGSYDNSKTRFLKVEELIKRDKKIYDEGIALFAKHFESLWY